MCKKISTILKQANYKFHGKNIYREKRLIKSDVLQSTVHENGRWVVKSFIARGRSMEKVGGVQPMTPSLPSWEVEHLILVSPFTPPDPPLMMQCSYVVGFLGVMSTGAPGDGISMGNMSTHISTLPWRQTQNHQLIEKCTNKKRNLENARGDVLLKFPDVTFLGEHIRTLPVLCL